MRRSAGRGARGWVHIAEATAKVLRSLGAHLREWNTDVELDSVRPGLAEAAEECAAQLDSVAEDLERGAGAADEAVDDLARAHGQLGAELRSAARAAARRERDE